MHMLTCRGFRVNFYVGSFKPTKVIILTQKKPVKKILLNKMQNMLYFTSIWALFNSPGHW